MYSFAVVGTPQLYETKRVNDFYQARILIPALYVDDDLVSEYRRVYCPECMLLSFKYVNDPRFANKLV